MRASTVVFTSINTAAWLVTPLDNSALPTADASCNLPTLSTTVITATFIASTALAIATTWSLVGCAISPTLCAKTCTFSMFSDMSLVAEVAGVDMATG